MSLPLFTCHNEFQVKGVLPGAVAGDTGVDARVAAGHRLDDQWVHAVFPHQHLMGGVWADGLSIQLPDEVGGGQAAHLQGAKQTANIKNPFTEHVNVCRADALILCSRCWFVLECISRMCCAGAVCVCVCVYCEYENSSVWLICLCCVCLEPTTGALCPGNQPCGEKTRLSLEKTTCRCCPLPTWMSPIYTHTYPQTSQRRADPCGCPKYFWKWPNALLEVGIFWARKVWRARTDDLEINICYKYPWH